MAVEEGKSCCVVLVPSPFQGHITPMLQLASLLHAKGFSIVINHSELNPPDSSKHPEFTFFPLKDGLSNNDPSFLNLFDIIPEMNVNCRVPFRDYLVQMMEKPEIYGQISCIIYDHLMYFTTEVAVHLKLPTILLRASSCAYMEAVCAFFSLKAENYFPLPESQLLDPVPKVPILRFKDLPCDLISEIPEPKLQLFEKVVNLGFSVAIIFNTIENLENHALSWLQKHYRVPIFTIGPLHKIASSQTSLVEEDTSCISWLNTQAPNSVLYVSIGSIVVMDKNEFIETAWGLFNSNQSFLWVVRPSSIEHDLPDGYLEAVGDRGRIVKWAPQKEVLAHPAVGGFWSHCGWNSTLESILEGVPMICRPCFGDQKVNARYLTHVWKIGLEIGPDDLTRCVIESTIRKLMVEEEGKELRQRVLDMKQKLQMSFLDGGSSHNSLKSLTEFISSRVCQY
ncbi:UDP-glucose iridoid glucosyltransferase-like [Lycium ferocissimum]|uniref:UDP-glucose iridoid glucosyltransferase-like n=1 Tax=Lycium ferocissimum TaxID=112874 RepID=UPI00281630F2|nr:UDP-glucose iridoid glucosyltransferase-like [Lycium ferocissimum]